MDRRSILSEITNDLGICRCGSPADAYEAVHKLLLALQKSSSPLKDWGDWYSLVDNDPYALVLAYTLDGMGYIEHGTSVRHPWLTNKGRCLIEAFNILKEKDYDLYGDNVCSDSDESL